MPPAPATPIEGRWAMTGAAGSVGRHLRSTLANMFEELVVLDVVEIDDPARHEQSAVVDLGDLDALQNALVGVDGIIHLGGLADEADFYDLAAVNVVGTFNLLEAARLNAVRRVVYAGSNRVTGFYPTTDVVGPADPVRPDGLYGVAKAATEALCRLYVDKFGIEIACLRIGSFADRPTTPRELHTWLSPKDCTAAFRAAIEAQYDFTTFYAVSDNTQPWWDLSAGAAVGFAPQDDAADWAGEITGAPMEPQGGTFATAQFTLSRQHHLRDRPR